MAHDDILKLYGSLVGDLFHTPHQKQRVELFSAPPHEEHAPPHTEDFELLEHRKNELRNVLPTLIPPNDQTRIDHIVADFRKNLDPSTGTTGKPLREHTARDLKHFQDQIAAGQELSLEHNPFHELTRLLFQATLKGLFAFFAREFRSRIPSPPPPVRYSPTLREIWLRPKEFGGLFTKLAATLSKWIILTRPPLAILLFIGSSYTTYRGVNDLLQSQEAGSFILELFQGHERESRRYLVSLCFGVALSAAILDFKTRMFTAIAESGRVFAGIRDAFFIHPRWMVLALLLTSISIKTNFDGIVSIFSKKEDLAGQAAIIKKGIQEALGNRFFASTDAPDSLFDLKAVLDDNLATLIPMLENIPNEEAEGLASSGDARKGPRYWAKHFIVFGGYEPGISDVNLSHNSPFAQSIDLMLSGAGIDFFTSMRQKIELLRNTYTHELEKTENAIAERLTTLDTLMSADGYSLKEIQRLLALEHYQINALVGTIVTDLEHTKETYGQVVEDLHDLTKAYLEILLQVDLSGNIQPGNYAITASMNIPRIEGIDKLRAGMIPEARHKSFSELRFFLVERYGVATGGLLLALILFLSISMDLADPILFSRSVARHGRRDHESVQMLLEELSQWEKQFTRMSHEQLDSPPTRAVLNGRSHVTRNDVEMKFHQQIEQLDAETKHPRDRNPGETFILWFMGMFLLNRPTWTRSYNVRLATLNRFIEPDKTTLEQWFAAFFLPSGKLPGTTGPVLTETTARIHDHAQRNKEQINRIIKECTRQQEAPETDAQGKIRETALSTPSPAPPPSRFLLSWVATTSKPVIDGFKLIFFRGIKPPPPWFPLSYFAWRTEFFHNLVRSSNLKNLIAKLQPELQSLLEVTIPSILENSYFPTVDIRNKYGQHLPQTWHDRFEAFQAKLMTFEENLLGSLGIVPLLTGPGSQSDFLETLNSMESSLNLGTNQILEMLTVIDHHREHYSDQHVIAGLALEEESQRLLKEASDLIARVREEEERIKRMEEEARHREMEALANSMDQTLMELRELFKEISQSILRMKMRELNYRKKGFPSQSVMLNYHLNRSIMDQVPREVDAIIQIMETILQSEYPYNQPNFETLLQLKGQTIEILDRLSAFQDFNGVVSGEKSKREIHPITAKRVEEQTHSLSTAHHESPPGVPLIQHDHQGFVISAPAIPDPPPRLKVMTGIQTKDPNFNA
ncbi:MAG: hypothetical protein HQL83_13135 [Magnetococcales bacterium]|nr:hypothetical protein [Magnetococcales bacterium]